MNFKLLFWFSLKHPLWLTVERYMRKIVFSQSALFPMQKYWIDWNNKFALSNCNLHVVPIFVFIFYSVYAKACISHQILVMLKTVGLFTNVVAKWPGSTHDSFAFTNSLIHERLESNHVFEDGYLLGVSGYPCKPFLMTPYPNPANAKQEAFNKAHCQTRVAIEQTFGRWKRRFHLLHSECRMKPEKVCTIIGACAVLHNNDFYSTQW